MSLWARIKEHKVAQWTLAYAAAAYTVLHGTEMVSNAFAWPHLLVRIVTLLLILGLPLVVTIAWYHGHRAQRRVGRAELTIITVLLVIAGAALWHFARPSQEHATAKVGSTVHTRAEAVRPLTATPAEKSIAVLPFQNRSREADDAFFVDGVHYDILTQLSKVRALKVISRTSVERFRGSKLSLQQIAHRLGVTSILEGGVQRAGERVRIHVQLTDANSDAQIWAESYDRELSAANIFGIQSDVAAAITVALKAALTSEERARVNAVPTQNLKAWEAYQIGRQRMAQRTSTALAHAEQSFRRSIALDPAFALGHVGLADVLQLQVDYSGAPVELTLRNAEAAAQKAIELSPDLAEAWTSSAGIASERFQFDRAEVMFRRALELNPNYALARHWYGTMLAEELFRTDEALTQVQRAAELDPFSGVIRDALGVALEQKGHFQEAADAYRQSIGIDPTRPNPYLNLADLKVTVLNDFPGAIAMDRKAIELDPDGPKPVCYLGGHYSDLGDHARAMELLSKAVARWTDDYALHFYTAFAHLYIGDDSAAKRHAQRSLDLYPRLALTLALIRDADLRAGRLAEALSRYQKSYPELFGTDAPRIDRSNFAAAIDLAHVMQKLGEAERANQLLDGAERVIRHIPRLGFYGYSIADVRIHALKNRHAQALSALREAERAGWRIFWRYHRDFDPILDSIRGEPEFKAVFADIERDLAQQRARLAARPKNAPLEL
jgi:TolB-like protein/Tfp pilus assembly protein PilF